MKTKMRASGRLLGMSFAVAALVPTLSLSQSAPPTTKPDAPREASIGQEVGDAADAIKNYSAAQRDEAEKKAKATLHDVDARIAEIEGRISKNWNSMSQAARDHAQTTLRAMRKKRNEVAEWYGAVKHSSAEAWDEVKRGFAKSYRDLAESVSKARQEF